MLFTLLLLSFSTIETPKLNPELEARVTKLETTAAGLQKGLLGLFVSLVGGLGSLLIFAKKKAKKQIERLFNMPLTQLGAALDEALRLANVSKIPIAVCTESYEFFAKVLELNYKGAKKVEQFFESNDYNLLIIDGDSLKQNTIVELLKCSNHQAVVIYSTQKINIRSPRVTFSNSYITLNARVMEALAYLNNREKTEKKYGG